MEICLTMTSKKKPQAVEGLPPKKKGRPKLVKPTIPEHRKIRRRKEGAAPTKKYFDDSTQEQIVQYQAAEDLKEKRRIYVEHILPAFDSLVENLINVYGFTVALESKNDLKIECLEFLYTTVNKFDASKGSKAFSYFNVVAKHWLTIKSKQNAKRVQTYISIDDTESISKDDLDAIEAFQTTPAYDEIYTPAEKRANLNLIMDKIEEKIKTDNEKIAMSAIKTLVTNLDDIDLLSKRASLCYLRELTGLNSKQLSMVLSNLKRHYKEIKKTEIIVV